MKLPDAHTLAAQFDGSFALAHPELQPFVDVIAVQIGGDGYALRISEIAGVFVDQTITHVPTQRTDLLGIAGFRGSIVPVLDLAVILGYTPPVSPRWLVVAAAERLAFAFEGFDGHLRVPATAISRAPVGTPTQAHVRDIAHSADRSLSVIELASLSRRIAEQGT